MAAPKKYFHDHYVLLLLSVNVFLAVAGSLFVILSLSTGNGHGTSYIYQCRNCSNSLAVNRFTYGGIGRLLSFIPFLLLVLTAHTMLSLRAYKLHRQLAIIILALGILLLILTIIVSNALLVLH